MRALALTLLLSNLFGCAWPVGRSRGELVADIGMTFDEVIQRSTLKLKTPYHMQDGTYRDTQGDVFDFRIGDSHVVFPRSRYYVLITRNADPLRLAEINIGITPEKMPKAGIETFQRSAQDQMFADGWMPGHFLAKNEETVTLWAGKHTTGEGRYWLRGNTLLIFQINRMDERQRDEPEGAGEFILYIDLRPKGDEPELVFERSAWPY